MQYCPDEDIYFKMNKLFEFRYELTRIFVSIFIYTVYSLCSEVQE